MNETKKEYLERQIAGLTQSWSSTVLFVGIILFPLLGIMDFFATPENFGKFALYRLVITLLLAVLFLLNRQKVDKNYQYAIILIGISSSAAAIELMILSYGGHQSPYYAGLNLVTIAVFGFLPISMVVTSIGVSIVYAIYLIPIILLDPISDMPRFISNNAFMISTFVIALAWRFLSQKSLMNELSLQYDLDKEKKNLEQYSTQLEELVNERTKELNKSEQWHRSLFDNATDGIIVMNRNGIIVNANEKASEMHGFSKDALAGAHIKLLEDMVNAVPMAERIPRMLGGEPHVFETLHNKKDGTRIILEASAKAISIGDDVFIQCFYRDITERKKMQEYLFQSQKMDSIGVLAGGIAHDLNNILTAILGHAEIISRHSKLDEKATSSLVVIEDASRRAGRMISKLLGFARKSRYDLVPLNLNDVVYDTIKLLERVIDKNIEMSVELDSHLPLIQGDVNHIEQIIMNLIVNARDAMPAGGKLAIRTLTVTVTPGMTGVPSYILPGEYVVLSTADTGTGIPDDIVSKIFEPFFTTKERGKGTGLGLSMVYGTIKEHKGYITVASAAGAGTTFTVYLPVTQATALAQEQISQPSVGGNETLLVVDDDEAILKAMLEPLSAHGYKVFAISDSPSALNIFNKLQQEISLVITDIAMPHMDGRELIKKVKAIKPEINILAMSGYAKYIADKDGIREMDGFMKKPFESAYLLSVVRRILDARNRSDIAV